MGELLCPCLAQGSVGVVYPVRPQEEQPQWRGQLWSPGVSSRRNSGALRLQGLEALGRVTDLLSSRQERPCGPGPSRPLPVPGEAGSWAVSWRPVLRGLRCWIRAPAPQPPSRSRRPSPQSCSWNHAAPAAEPPPEPSELLRVPPGPAVRAAALRELGALSWVRRCLLVSQGA